MRVLHVERFTDSFRITVAKLAFAAGFATLALVSRASAQDRPSVDVRTFRPSTDPRAHMVLEPVTVPAAWNPNVAAWFAYANRPVRLRDGGTGLSYRPIEHQLHLDLTAGIALGAHAHVGVGLPIALYQSGTANLPRQLSSSSSAPASALGDLALHGKVTVVSNDQGGLGVGALAVLTLPTGDRTSFLGEGALTASARVLVDYDLLIAGVQASVGYKLRSAERPWPDTTIGGTTFGGEVPWTFGVRVRPGVLKKVVEIDHENRQMLEIAVRGALPFGPVGPFGSGDPGSARLSPVLLALSDRIELGHFRDSFLLVGVDIGLTGAIGVPTARGIVALGWAPRGHDLDRDGVQDDLDQCPEIPEDRDGYEDSDGCPDIDNDEDGVTDDEDACPRLPGEPSDDKKANGCPVAAGSASRPSNSRSSDEVR
jgi:OmpA-OmpF porin, OOP family